MTQRLPTAVARKDFANVLRDSAAGERIKLTRYNKTVAVIIPTKDLADLEDCQKDACGGRVVGAAAERKASPIPGPQGSRPEGSQEERKVTRAANGAQAGDSSPSARACWSRSSARSSRGVRRSRWTSAATGRPYLTTTTVSAVSRTASRTLANPPRTLDASIVFIRHG